MNDLTKPKNTVGKSHLGNTYGLAIKDPEVRQKAYKSLCEHLSKGLSYHSWFYEDEEGNSCVGKTMLSYIKGNPSEFPSIKKDVADAKGFAFWEGVLMDSATGKNKDASTASLQMIMRNKYGWDKEDKQENQNQNRALATNYPKLDPNDIRVSVQVLSPQLPNPDTLGA
jgi:hypothetical protein